MINKKRHRNLFIDPVVTISNIGALIPRLCASLYRTSAGLQPPGSPSRDMVANSEI